MVTLLEEAQVRELADMGLALEVVEKAFRKIGLEEATNSPRSRGQTDHAHIYGMIAGAKGLQSLGLKVRTTSRKGKPEQLVLLFHGKTGEFTCLMQAEYLEQLRGGAAGGVAIKTLAREDASTIGIIGSGRQARMQLRAAKQVRPVNLATVYSTTAEHSQAFASEMSQELGIEVRSVSTPREAVQGRDIVVLATSTRDPIFFEDWIEPGVHINAMGSTFLGKAELAADVFSKIDVTVVDQRESARLEAGDLVEPIEKGLLFWRDVRDLGPLLVGRYDGRAHAGQVTLFKSVGLGIQDVTLGQAILEKAKSQGLGGTLNWKGSLPV